MNQVGGKADTCGGLSTDTAFLFGNGAEGVVAVEPRSSLSRLALSQTGMSAGRNLMKWKSRRREVPERLEPSLSDGALAEEEGLDR